LGALKAPCCNVGDSNAFLNFVERGYRQNRCPSTHLGLRAEQRKRGIKIRCSLVSQTHEISRLRNFSHKRARPLARPAPESAWCLRIRLTAFSHPFAWHTPALPRPNCQ
jgi:hypothetical protein